jgi:plasmid maintenance system antidote protein VapI
MEKEMNAKNLKTQAEYARMIGVSRARVNQMINEKKLTVVYIGGAKLIWVPTEQL